MVPQHTEPPDPSRRLSPKVETELEVALRAVALGSESADTLKRALQAAAQDARSRQLRAEELLIAFKEIEARLATSATDPLMVGDSGRNRLIRTLIEAYYAAKERG